MWLFGLAILCALLAQVSLEDFAAVAKGADPRWLTVAVLVGLSATIFRAIRYTAVFPVQERWLMLFGTFAFMRLVNVVCPFRSGEVVSMALLKKHRLAPSIAETTPWWLLLKISDVVALTLLMAAGAGIASFKGSLGDGLRWAQMLMLGLWVPLCVVLLGLIVAVNRFPSGIGGKWIQGRLQAFRVGASRVRDVRILCRVVLLAMPVWLAVVTLPTLGQLAIGVPLSPMECWFTSLLVCTINMLPVHPPLALGTGEAAWTGVLMVAGLPPSDAIVAAVAIRVLGLLVLVLDGCVGLCILRLRCSTCEPRV